jgi:hypothetical protein
MKVVMVVGTVVETEVVEEMEVVEEIEVKTVVEEGMEIEVVGVVMEEVEETRDESCLVSNCCFQCCKSVAVNSWFLFHPVGFDFLQINVMILLITMTIPGQDVKTRLLQIQ